MQGIVPHLHQAYEPDLKIDCFLNMKQETLITINPDIRFGKPCINNTRIAVVDILEWLASGMTYEEIHEDFPEINNEHILAALAFAAKRENITKISAA